MDMVASDLGPGQIDIIAHSNKTSNGVDPQLDTYLANQMALHHRDENKKLQRRCRAEFKKVRNEIRTIDTKSVFRSPDSGSFSFPDPGSADRDSLGYAERLQRELQSERSRRKDVEDQLDQILSQLGHLTAEVNSLKQEKEQLRKKLNTATLKLETLSMDDNNNNFMIVNDDTVDNIVNFLKEKLVNQNTENPKKSKTRNCNFFEDCRTNNITI
jgi:regulator of replication initiation timing